MNLKSFKKNLKQIVPIKEQERMFYKNVIENLLKYEEVSNKKATEEFQMIILAGEGKRIDMRDKIVTLGD